MKDWPLEHRKALALSAGLGAALGLTWGIHTSPEFWNTRSCIQFLGVLLRSICGRDLSPWFGLIEGPIIGVICGAAVIYVWKLMKS